MNRRNRAQTSRGRRRLPWANLGLRARLTLTFGLGALALSASVAGLTYFTARQFSMTQRQDADVHQAFSNAGVTLTRLREGDRDFPALLSELDQYGSGSIVVPNVQKGKEYSVHFLTIPKSFMNLVETSDVAATQRIDVKGTPTLMVGISLPSENAAYFEFFSLEDLSTELKLLGLALATAALFTTIAGAAIGRLAARRVLLPLVSVSNAAETIAGGRLDTRLDSVKDKDLAPLIKSFNRMADALQDRIQHEARFTSDVSHELRSPLTTLSASLGVLDSHREELSPKGKRALELLDVEVRRFQRMVDDLLEISRIDAGSAELLLDEVEVGELIRRAAASTGAKGVPIDISAEAVGVRLLVDKRRMERVVANLVENAAQYAGGATRLAVERSNGSVRIIVADHGPGVVVSERSKIFDRFYRGQSSGQRGATNGTGLGLALVAEHVALHGGRVWVEDGAGAENRFIVALPLPNPEDLSSAYDYANGDEEYAEDYDYQYEDEDDFPNGNGRHASGGADYATPRPAAGGSTANGKHEHQQIPPEPDAESEASAALALDQVTQR
jgi:two-component system sensor histidine kinase MtrB